VEFFHQKFVVVNKESVGELFAAGEDELSFATQVADALEIRHTFAENVHRDHYHAVVVRMQLSRHIPRLMGDIVDELGVAMDEAIHVGEGNPLSDVGDEIGLLS
jgi:hypothetical protein